MVAATLLALLRGLHLAATLSVLGTALARCFVAPPALARALAAERARVETALTRLLRLSVFVAVIAALAWLFLQAFVVSGAAGAGDAIAALPDLLLQTGFGKAWLARVALLALAGLVYGSGRSTLLALTATELACVGVAVQVGMGHAAAAADWDLPESEILHLLAAGAWLGGLLPLLLIIRALPPPLGFIAARRFSPVGIAAVALLAITALLQTALLVGGLPGLLGTDYGRLGLGKLVLFLALLALAAANRSLFTPQLAGKQASAGKRALLRSITAEIAIGTAVLLLASTMATLPPGLHEQPVWPFAWRPSSDALFEPELRGEAILSLALMATALLMVAGGIAWRAVRFPALGGAPLLLFFGVAHLGPLLVPAYPTSYFQSTSGFTTVAIARGALLYERHCLLCHGAGGRGDGAAAPGLPLPPADLTAEHLSAHSDGELFWWLSEGMDSPSGARAMPGFAAVLSEQERWQLIDYLHALNAGAAVAPGTGEGWRVPLAAPDFALSCGNGDSLPLSELRGRVLRLVAGRAVEAGGLLTLRLDGRPAGPQDCVGDSAADRVAYALLAGRTLDAFDGTQFLIDGSGFLRALWRPGEPPGWTEPAALAALVSRLATAPLKPAGGHAHR